jgi:hypothetical protein
VAFRLQRVTTSPQANFTDLNAIFADCNLAV